MSKYLNPYTDFGFKKLFGEENNKDLLQDFLNQLLPQQHQIAELQFQNTEQLPDLAFERKAIFDIHCISTTGKRFIVEMQKAKLEFFKDRAVFYVTFPIRDQAKTSKWLFELQPVYFIAILDFTYDDNVLVHKLRRDVALRDIDGELFFDKLHFTFLQMPLFTKQEHELVTRFDKWLYFLKNLESFDPIPTILHEQIFKKAFHSAELANLSREQYTVYEQNLLDYLGVKAALVTAKNEGFAEGLEKGRAGGLVEGEAKGEANGLRKIALAMLQKGLDQGIIQEVTGLSAEYLLQLLANAKTNYDEVC